MNIPEPSGDNMYKYVATLGVFLMIVSIYSGAVVASKYNESYVKTMETFYIDTIKNSPEQEKYRKNLNHWLTQETKNTNFFLKSLSYIFVFSFLMSAIGFYFWYTRIQRYSDAKLKQEAKA